jgi:hypothetical protein
MLLPTVLDIPRETAFSAAQPCPHCEAPVSVQRWVSTVYDDPSNPDDEEADHISHRVLVHGEVPLICFPNRRPFDVLADDWAAICDALNDAHNAW